MCYQDGSYDLVKAFYEPSSIKKIWFSENNSKKKKKDLVKTMSYLLSPKTHNDL